MTEGTTFLSSFLLILLSATFVALIFERFRLPTLLGFLLAGVFVGPHGFGLIQDSESVHVMAELGVALLLLSIGLELSMERLKGMRKVAIFGGSLQIFLSILVALLFAKLQGWSLYQGFFLGSILALSSTAIVLKNLIDRGELDTQHGRVALSILIFQDFAIVPMMIVTANFGSDTSSALPSLVTAFVKMILFLIAAIVASRFLFPHLLRYVAMRRNREVFFLTCIVSCLGISWLSAQLGLSFAIGAFFAGVIFANTDYSGQLIGEMASFRHVFVSIFFVSIGMLFNVEFALEHFLLIATVVGLVLLVNFIIMSLIIVAFKYPPRIAFAAGLILSQIGEFSFLLLELGQNVGAIDSFFYNILLSTAFITMLLTPALFMLLDPLFKISDSLPFFGIPPKDLAKKTATENEHLKDHVILCGYGVTGKALALMLQEEKIPFLIVEMNPKHIKEARENKMFTLYGDGANLEVIERAGIKNARAVVVSFGDSIGMAQIIRAVEHLNPDVMLAVRTRFVKDAVKFYELGCDVVVMEEWEASEELNKSVLTKFGIPKERIEQHMDRVKQKKELLIEEAIMKSQKIFH